MNKSINDKFSNLIATFDADSGIRGKQFEVFVKWFLLNDPDWATQVDQVWLWSEYPQRWGADCGIDLVFRHKNGEIWSVQAKCYAPNYDITKHDVDKFLSESNRKGIDKCLLIATTDRIGANARQVCDAQEKTVIRYLRANFESANVDYPATFSALNTAKPKARPQPFAHQAEAIAAVGTQLLKADRGQLIMACGTGKTFTTLWIKEHLAAKTTLVLLPSLGLLSQTLHEWTLAANSPFEVLCVCSDATVGKRGGDEAIHCVADLAFPVTSDTGEIKAFLQRSGAKVVFSTYQSSPLLAEVQADITINPFDLVIADEAHRCAGKASSDFSTVLDATRIRATKRLFTTATPRTYSSVLKKAAGERGVEVVGMDDVAVFGEVLFSLPFGEAIKRGLLTDYRVVIIGVDSPTIAQWIENRELLKTHSGIEIDAESLAAQIGVLKAFKDYDLHRVISFHSRVTRAEAFTHDLQEVMHWVDVDHKPSGTLKTDFVSGAMPTDQRRRKLAQLKALAPQERGLLANARCLSEGVDVPSLDGVAFIDPRRSQIDIIQAVGRAIRLSANKTLGTIVLPVFIEHADSPAACIEASNFKPIWEVLNALKAHDDVLSAELDQLRTELGRKLGTTLGTSTLSKINFDLPASVDQSFGAALRTLVVEQVTDTWDFWYGLLQDYAAEHGDCLVNQDLMLSNGYALGVWVGTQRGSKEKMVLSRSAKLEALPGWSWNPKSDQWDKGFLQLKTYSETNGNCLVNIGFKLSNGYTLGRWVSKQRGSKEKLTVFRRSKLEALSGWTWTPHSDQWDKGFLNLQCYSDTHGTSLVNDDLKLSDGYSLGTWVGTQRTSKDRLDAFRKAKLEALPGWSWDPQSDQWDTGFLHLQTYLETHGNSLVSQNLKLSNGYALGVWLNTQRRSKEKISLSRREKLEALPDWSWNPVSDLWDKGFLHLQSYSETHGNCLVNDDLKLDSGYGLGTWVGAQRAAKEKLALYRREKLEALPGWSWDPNLDLWETGFFHLENYFKMNGNSLVKNEFRLSNGYALGGWVKAQRAAKNRLEISRRAKLEALPGWSWNPKSDQWEVAFCKLKAYSKMHGNCLVKKDLKLTNGYSLGGWVNAQRAAKDRLEVSRKAKLEALPGWSWNVFDDQWENGFSELQCYSETNGNCLVIDDLKFISGFPLARWVITQRTKKEEMPLSRRTKLEALPGWSWNARDDKWEVGFLHLQRYSVAHGTCLVGDDLKLSNGYALGTWVGTQRRTKEKMALSRVAKLEDLTGWTWHVNEDSWEKAFIQLRKYSEIHGNCLIKRGLKWNNGPDLGSWVSTQRAAKDRLAASRIAKLEALRGWSWEPYSDHWEKGFQHLKVYVALHDNCLVPGILKLPDGYALGNWVDSQKSRKSGLSPERLAKLESLPGWTWRTKKSLLIK